MKKINKKKIIGILMIVVSFLAVIFVFIPRKTLVSEKYIPTATSSSFVVSENLKKDNYENLKSSERIVLVQGEKFQKKAYLLVGEVSYTLDFNSGDNLFDSMQRLKDSGKINFEAKNYSGIGEFIYSINGIKSDGSNYWIYYINGKEAQIGVSNYKLKDDDQIEWKFEKSKY